MIRCFAAASFADSSAMLSRPIRRCWMSFRYLSDTGFMSCYRERNRLADVQAVVIHNPPQFQRPAHRVGYRWLHLLLVVLVCTRAACPREPPHHQGNWQRPSRIEGILQRQILMITERIVVLPQAGVQCYVGSQRLQLSASGI